MDVVVLLILLDDHVGVAIVELTQELGILSYGLEFFNPVYFYIFLAALGKERLSLGLQLANVDV